MVTLTWTPSAFIRLTHAMGHGQAAAPGWDKKRPRLVDDADHQRAVDDMQAAWAGDEVGGPVVLHVRVFFPSMNQHSRLAGTPIGMAHRFVPAVERALRDRVDPGQIVKVTATKRHDPKHQRVEVDIEPWKGPSDV